MDTHQLKKDVEYLEKMKYRLMVAQTENKKIESCINRAYSHLNKAVVALDELTDLLMK